MKLSARAVFTVVATSALLLAGSTSASAAVSPSTEKVKASSSNCWLNADTGETACFESQAAMEEGIESATGAELLYPTEADITRNSKLEARGIVAPAANYVAAVFYINASYSGNSFTTTTSVSDLCASHDYTYANLGTWLGGWEDKISSYRAYGNCKATVYSERNFAGATYGPASNAPNLYAMNESTSSIRVHR